MPTYINGRLIDGGGIPVPPGSSPGDTLYVNPGGVWDRLPGGAAGLYLQSQGPAVAPQWMPGGGGAVQTETVRVPFSFSSVSPVVIAAMLANQVVVNSEIQIDVAFNDPLATLQLGTPAVPGKMLSAAQNDPSLVDVYRNEENFMSAVPENMILTITPGASTQGSGSVVCQIKRS